MSCRRLRIDLAVPARRPAATGLGLGLCLAGLAATAAVAVAFQNVLAERARLDAAIDALAELHRAPVETPGRAAAQADTAKMNRELRIPWTKLLTELEAASNDMAARVSLLQVEPDADKRVVRITAEVRSLPDALAYLMRLQQSPMLRYPMLESHERRKDDPEHAVRIKVAAEWRS
jgi:hypothetical protein